MSVFGVPTEMVHAVEMQTGRLIMVGNPEDEHLLFSSWRWILSGRFNLFRGCLGRAVRTGFDLFFNARRGCAAWGCNRRL